MPVRARPSSSARRMAEPEDALDGLLGQTLRPGPDGQFGVSLSDTELLSLLTATPGPTGARVRELTFTPDGISLEATYQVLGLPIEVRLTGRLALAEGRLLAELGEVTLNGTAAPPIIRHQLARLAAEFAERLNRRAEFTRLELGDGYLHLGGRYRPRQ